MSTDQSQVLEVTSDTVQQGQKGSIVVIDLDTMAATFYVAPAGETDTDDVAESERAAATLANSNSDVMVISQQPAPILTTTGAFQNHLYF